jgi:hypothetical protein
MAVTTAKSAVITNRDATPKVISNSNLADGLLHEAVGQLELLTTDDATSKKIFCQIPSNARVSQVLLSCDDSGTAGAMDIGIYQTTANGSAVVDADFFASAQVLTTALANSDVTHESGVFGIEDAEKPLWEALGLSADPKIAYDVVGTITTAAEVQATVGLKVKYVL